MLALLFLLSSVSWGRTTHLSTVSASLILGHCPHHHQTRSVTQAVMLAMAALTFCLSLSSSQCRWPPARWVLAGR